MWGVQWQLDVCNGMPTVSKAGLRMAATSQALAPGTSGACCQDG